MLAFVLVLVAAAVVVLVLSSPFRRPAPADVTDADEGKTVSEVAVLEAAKEAKYREIRDAELDYDTGKLSDEDHRSVDSTLRAEALAILLALDQARELGARRSTAPEP